MEVREILIKRGVKEIFTEGVRDTFIMSKKDTWQGEQERHLVRRVTEIFGKESKRDIGSPVGITTLIYIRNKKKKFKSTISKNIFFREVNKSIKN